MRSWRVGITRWAALLLVATGLLTTGVLTTGVLAADNPWDAEKIDVEAVTEARAATTADLKKPAEDAANEEKERYAAKQARILLLDDLLRILRGIRDFDSAEQSAAKKTALVEELAHLRKKPERALPSIRSAKDIAPFGAAVTESEARAKSVGSELDRLRAVQKEISTRLKEKSAREEELRKLVSASTNAAPDSLELFRRENAELELRLLTVLSANSTEVRARIDAAIARVQVERDLIRAQSKRASDELKRANEARAKAQNEANEKTKEDVRKKKQEMDATDDELVKYVAQIEIDKGNIEIATGKDTTRLADLKELATSERKKLDHHRRNAKRLEDRVDHRTRIAATTAERLHQTLLRIEGWRQTIALRTRPEAARNSEDLEQVLGGLQDLYWELELDPRETTIWSNLSDTLRIDRADETARKLEEQFRGPNSLREALRKRIAGVERLQEQYAELDSIYADQSETLREFETFIRGRIYWVRTDDRLGVHLLESASSELDELGAFYTDEKFVGQLRGLIRRKPTFVFGSTVFLLLLLIGSAVGARRIGRKQMNLGPEGKRLRNVLRDALIVLAHAAGPSIVLLIGVVIVRKVGYPGRIERPAVISMQWIAFLLFIQRFGWGMLRETGFLAAHFKLSPAVGRQLQRCIRIYTMGGMIFFVPFHILDAAQEMEAFSMPSLQRMFGTMFRFTELLAIALLLPRKLPIARAFVSGSETGLRIVGLLNPFMYIALLVIVLMDILGYRYGAVFFADKVIHNVVVIMILRGVYAGLNQISDRVVGRVRERAAEEHGGTAAWQDAAKVSRQLSRLISVATLVIAFVFLSQSWSMGAGSVSVLKEWTLMSFADAPSLTVHDVLAALLAIVGAHFLASNIAGLFELLVFPIFGTIHRGSRYVVLALTRYIILIIGYSAALVMVHFSLSSVGWLLTAASFGLGFGLQEIIANFVSGLMMMVEQPVRVGDVISVGNTSGTVERITIRATIVTNWDQQQIIIPNKEFITKNLTNWTRNNPFTRRKIPIRVAFGSDVEKILKLLEETVKGVENVRSYPPVRIWFSGVSEYTLDFMIWAYIDVDFGFSTQSNIRRAVHAALASEGVDIPLPQTDIHLKGGEDPRESAELLGDVPPSE